MCTNSRLVGVIVVVLTASAAACCSPFVMSEVTPMGPQRPARPDDCFVKVFPTENAVAGYELEDLASVQVKCVMRREKCVQRMKRLACRAGGDTAYVTSETTDQGNMIINATLARVLGKARPAAPQAPGFGGPAVAGDGTPVSRPEALAVLQTAGAEVTACAQSSNPPPALTLRVQVNGDGSAIFLGAEPSPPADVIGCLRGLVGSLRFRATGAPPVVFTTPPYQISSGW